MVKKAAKLPEYQPEETPRTGTSFFEYLRFGESYTSLILGIIVVIISTALLLSFVHNRNIGNVTPPTNNEESANVAQNTNQGFQITTVPSLTPLSTSGPSVTTQPTVTKQPTVVPTKPVAKPTAKPTVKPTEVQKKIAQATNVPTRAAVPTSKPQIDDKAAATAGTYTVKSGDSLWSIAESRYKSGYNWVDIARANKLSNPSIISAGTKLTLPKVTAKAPTVEITKPEAPKVAQKNTTPSLSKITGTSYKITRGDTLWSISERAYGTGYKWVDIARANKLSNPGLIHADNNLTLPRGK